MAHILAINPGSTSTKISLFDGTSEMFTETLRHSSEEIGRYSRVIDQYAFREETILKALEKHGVALSRLVAVVGRGGLLRPISSGTYVVNEAMIKDLKSAEYGEHASNLGGILAHYIAEKAGNGCQALIADPVVVDELSDVARLGGHPDFPHISVFHALNQKAIARIYAKENHQDYNSLNLVIAHMGGGVSVAAHCRGQVVDVNNALFGDGPFSPERSGGISSLQLAEACFSGKYSFEDIKKIIAGQGGVVAHLGTNSFIEVRKRAAAGDKKALLVSDAFIYNVAKAVGAMAASLSGKVDAILLTGGIAYAEEMMQQLADMVSFIAPVKVYPGEDEMSALAGNALSVLEGSEQIKTY